MTGPVDMPEAIAALRAALAAERSARQEAEARAAIAEAMVAHLKLLIAKLKRERFGPSAERIRMLDQLKLQLEELEAAAAEDEHAAQTGDTAIRGVTHRKPVRTPLPAHRPRERDVVPAPAACPCCGGALAKLGEEVADASGGCCRRSSRRARR